MLARLSVLFVVASEFDCLEGFPFHLWLGYGNSQLAWIIRAYQYGNSLNVLLSFSAVWMLCTKAAQYLSSRLSRGLTPPVPYPVSWQGLKHAFYEVLVLDQRRI